MRPGTACWLPARVSLGRRPRVEWVDAGSAPLSEPFYHQTLARLDGTARLRWSAPIGAGPLAPEAMAAPAPVSGLIFQISRCGSTLVANALRASRGAVVVSEAQPISALLLPEADLPASVRARRTEMLGTFATAWGQRRRGDESGVFFKFSSWNVMAAQHAGELWPAVPRVAVVRQPIEVMVSCLAQPTGWMELRHEPAAAWRRFGWKDDPKALSREEFCARAIGSMLGAIRELAGVHVADYRQMTAAGLASIYSHFGIGDSSANARAMEQTLATYSKDPAGSLAFVPDSAEKQRAASAAARSACERWAQPVYDDLLASTAR